MKMLSVKPNLENNSFISNFPHEREHVAFDFICLVLLIL